MEPLISGNRRVPTPSSSSVCEAVASVARVAASEARSSRLPSPSVDFAAQISVTNQLTRPSARCPHRADVQLDASRNAMQILI